MSLRCEAYSDGMRTFLVPAEAKMRAALFAAQRSAEAAAGRAAALPQCPLGQLKDTSVMLEAMQEAGMS